MVLCACRNPTFRFLPGHGRVCDRHKARGTVTGGSVQPPPEAGLRGVLFRSSADAGAAVQAKDDQQVQEVLEILPPFCWVCVRGDWGGECV